MNDSPQSDRTPWEMSRRAILCCSRAQPSTSKSTDLKSVDGGTVEVILFPTNWELPTAYPIPSPNLEWGNSTLASQRAFPILNYDSSEVIHGLENINITKNNWTCDDLQEKWNKEYVSEEEIPSSSKASFSQPFVEFSQLNQIQFILEICLSISRWIPIRSVFVYLTFIFSMSRTPIATYYITNCYFNIKINKNGNLH